MRIFLIALGALIALALFSWWEQQGAIRESDRLFAQGTQQVRVEIFPASEVTFFNEITNALISFERDASGVVVGLTLRQPGRLRKGQKAMRPVEAGEG